MVICIQKIWQMPKGLAPLTYTVKLWTSWGHWPSQVSLDINELSFKQFWPLPSFNHVRRWVQKSPFWAKNDQTWQGRWCPEVVYEGPKWSKMINITYFWPFGVILGPFGLFWIISDKTWFFASKQKSASWPKWFGAKNQVLSEIIQKSPNGPKMTPNSQKYVILIILDHFGPS